MGLRSVKNRARRCKILQPEAGRKGTDPLTAERSYWQHVL